MDVFKRNDFKKNYKYAIDFDLEAFKQMSPFQQKDYEMTVRSAYSKQLMEFYKNGKLVRDELSELVIENKCLSELANKLASKSDNKTKESIEKLTFKFKESK